MNREILEKLEDIAGADSVAVSRIDLICHSYDALNKPSLPDAVVFVEKTEQIVEILRLANRYGFPVTPRGAAAGYTGGSVPTEGGLVLCLDRMNKILDVDTENLLAVVEPGVVTADLQSAVAERGLMYPPDPASQAFSTIGGNIAENAGGLCAVKYGVTRDYVMELEAVLPTGELIRSGAKTKKCVVGYDLARLLVGSEGTLGVITKAILRLVPRPEATGTLLATFADVFDAGRTVSDVISSGVTPAAAEFIDRGTLACIEKYARIGLPTDAAALLLFEVDGEEESVKKEAEKIREACARNNASSIETANTQEEADKLWAARRSISPSLKQVAPTKVNEDVVFPRSRLAEALAGIDRIRKEFNLNVFCFGHVGDGNIHTNFMFDERDPDESARVKKAVQRLFEMVVEMEGSISGEHGIGFVKKPYIGLELSKATLEAMRRIKLALDPNWIMNPGKIFPD